MSSKTEISGVNLAVQKLQELEDRMKNDVLGFKDTDLDNIDKIIDALYELETERKESHDELEKETIRSSVLRHQLRILPGQIRDELMEAVMSARNSNAKVLTDLQDQLATMTQVIDTLTTKSNEYEQENSVLQPERELLKRQHEEIISQLNQRMADKAGTQITLNETRDQVRQANQDILDLEDGILQLKEDLIQERTEARQEKKRLKKAVLETTQKTREQKDQNIIKKRELDHFQERLTDSEGKLETVKKSIERYETSTLRLQEEERQLTAQLTQQKHMNDQSRIKGTEIMNHRIEEERKFKAAEQELQNAIKKFQNDIKAETARKEELGNRKVQVQDEFRDKDVLRDEDRKKVEAIDLVLQDSKLELNKKAEEVGVMQQEIVDMTQEIENLAESHQVVLAQLNKQIEDYKEQLSKERRERMEVQAQKDEVSRQLDDMRLETQAFMNNMTGAVHDGKKRHLELSNEGMLLQKQLKEDEAIVQDLERQLTEAQNAYEQMFNSFQMRQNTIESEVMHLEADMEQKTKEREVEKPVFEKLEKHFAQRTDEYEGMIKLTVGKKSKKSGLDDQLKRLQRETEMVKAPQVQLRDDIKHKRGMFVSQMKAFAGSTRDKEQEILQAGCKLRLVMEENHKFEAAIKKLLADLEEIQKQISDNEHVQEELERELQKQKQELLKKWESDVTMQEFFAIRDKATAEAFDRLLEQANKREDKINTVTERLMEELGVLGDFLDNVSRRRPERAKSKQSARSNTVLSRSKEGSQRQSRSRSWDRGQSRQSSKSPAGRLNEKELPTPRREDSRLSQTVNEKRLVLPKIV